MSATYPPTGPGQSARAIMEARRQRVIAALISEDQLQTLYYTEAEFKASVDLLASTLTASVNGLATSARVRQSYRRRLLVEELTHPLSLTDVSLA